MFLQPIGIAEKNVLVFGEGRLRAVRGILKRPNIDMRVVRLDSIVDGEYHRERTPQGLHAE